MKNKLEAYYKFFIYCISILIFIISVYSIIINFNHAIFLNKKVIVSDSFNDYKEFKNNIVLIENNLDVYKNNELYNPINKVIFLLKNDGVFRLFPNDELSFYDLYYLNNYFKKIIDEGWFVNFNNNSNINTDYYNEYVDLLVDNANYIDKELLNNSNYSYNINNNIRDNINDDYKYILNNYNKLSYLILEISNKMGDKYA